MVFIKPIGVYQLSDPSRIWFGQKEELHPGTNKQTYMRLNIRNRLQPASRRFDYTYLRTKRHTCPGFIFGKEYSYYATDLFEQDGHMTTSFSPQIIFIGYLHATRLYLGTFCQFHVPDVIIGAVSCYKNRLLGEIFNSPENFLYEVIETVAIFCNKICYNYITF